MPHQHADNEWMNCTLCRAQKQGIDVFRRARERKVEWPKPKEYLQNPIQDPLVYTTIDDAFAGILQYMTTTTRQCKRYYRSNPRSCKDACDKDHCNRFHTREYVGVQPKNPLQSPDDLHLVVQPGTYAVTAGGWEAGAPRQQTHVVNVEEGQSVNLDFIL